MIAGPMLCKARFRTLAAFAGLGLLLACSGADDSDAPVPPGVGGTHAGGTGGQGGSPAGVGGGGGAGGGGECIPGQATFAWIAPNQREDQSCLTNLAAYALLYGEESGNYTHRTEVPLASTNCTDTPDENACGVIQECSVTIVGLTPQLWYFALIAIDGDGIESPPSNEVSKDLSCPDEE